MTQIGPARPAPPHDCIIDDFVISYLPPELRPSPGFIARTGTHYGRKGVQTITGLETHIRDLQRIVDYAKAEADAAPAWEKRA